jgi:hypothetical protein
MPFQIGSGHGWGGARELVQDTDRQAFLKRKLIGFGVDSYQ